jgi:uncharacterized membrane protein YdjX (TVP38/TMEM64 family)
MTEDAGSGGRPRSALVRWARRALVVAALAGLALLVWTLWDRTALTTWMSEARPLPFFVAATLLTALGAPITPVFLVAGATFGVRVGLLGSFLALTANLAVTYWVARSSLRPWLESLLRRLGHELPDFGGAGRSSLRFALMVKLAPGVPAFLKNHALAVAGVPFPLYLGLSLLITGAYAAALVVVGESLLEHDLGRSLALTAAVALAVAIGLLWWRRRRATRRRVEQRHAAARA